jgi:hypothetical protein
MPESRGIIAFDPGKGGGLAIYRPGGKIDLRPWTVEHELLDVIDSLDPSGYDAVVEDVPAFVSAATSNASSFKLGYNFGFIVGCCRMHGLPTNLVKPKEWQKGLSGLKPNMGYTARKRQLKDNAVRLYPDLKITNATADAVLIMHHRRNPS